MADNLWLHLTSEQGERWLRIDDLVGFEVASAEQRRQDGWCDWVVASVRTKHGAEFGLRLLRLEEWTELKRILGLTQNTASRQPADKGWAAALLGYS